MERGRNYATLHASFQCIQLCLSACNHSDVAVKCLRCRCCGGTGVRTMSYSRTMYSCLGVTELLVMPLSSAGWCPVGITDGTAITNSSKGRTDGFDPSIGQWWVDWYSDPAGHCSKDHMVMTVCRPDVGDIQRGWGASDSYISLRSKIFGKRWMSKSLEVFLNQTIHGCNEFLNGACASINSASDATSRITLDITALILNTCVVQYSLSLFLSLFLSLSLSLFSILFYEGALYNSYSSSFSSLSLSLFLCA